MHYGLNQPVYDDKLYHKGDTTPFDIRTYSSEGALNAVANIKTTTTSSSTRLSPDYTTLVTGIIIPALWWLSSL
jgi:hypothetical protein